MQANAKYVQIYRPTHSHTYTHTIVSEMPVKVDATLDNSTYTCTKDTKYMSQSSLD